MTIKGLRAFLLATALGGGVLAGAGFASAQTLSDTLVQAYQTSPLLDSNRAGLRSQDEAIPQARAARRPQLSASAGAGLSASSVDDFNDQYESYRAGLDASLLLYDHGQTAAALEAARMTIAASRASLRNVEQAVLYDAVQAFMDVRRDADLLEVARYSVSVLEEQLRAANNRFEVGEVTRTDVSLTEAQLAATRSELAAAEGNLEISRQFYRAAVGVLPGVLAPPPPLPDLPATAAEAQAIGLRQNPNIVAAQFAERAAIADFDRARAAKGPSVQATGSVGYQNSDSAAQREVTAADIGLSASIPLYTGGRNDSLIRQAQAILEQRQFQLQDSGRSVTEAVNAAWTNINVARASIISGQRQIEAARIAYDGVAEEARLGARSTLDVLNADQDRREAEALVVQARRNEYVAAYALLQAMGLLTAEHLGLGVDLYDPDANYQRVQAGGGGGYDTSAVDRIRARWEGQ